MPSFWTIDISNTALTFSQDLTNATSGNVRLAGSLVVDGGLTNDGLIVADGASNLVGDVANGTNGTVHTTSGFTTFFGAVTNDGEIRTDVGATATFFGTVSGSGSFTGGGLVQLEDGVNPGSSPGPMMFEGDVSVGGNANLQIELAGHLPGKEYDVLSVDGQLSLDGRPEILALAGFEPEAGDSFSIIVASGGVGGEFSSVVDSLDPLLDVLVSYDVASVALVFVPALTGDYNVNGVVDAADYSVWRNHFGSTTQLAADGNGNGVIDRADYAVWQANLGNVLVVPEPSSWVLLFGFLTLFGRFDSPNNRETSPLIDD